jgi:hypothetical protein
MSTINVHKSILLSTHLVEFIENILSRIDILIELAGGELIVAG